MALDLPIPTTLEEYNKEILPWLDDLKIRTKMGSEWMEAMRWYGRRDLYFLTRHILDIGKVIHSKFNTPFFEHQFFVDAARHTERHMREPESLDRSGRRSGKSELRSCAALIQLILNYPDIAILIQSVRKDLSLKHFERIKGELTRCKLLLHLYPDVLSINPIEESKSSGLLWSKSEGIVVFGRKLNRSVATVEVAALFGSPPVGSGYDVLAADDVQDSVWAETPDKLEKLDAAFSESLTLLTPVVMPQTLVLMSNTMFAAGDLVNRTRDRLVAKDPDLVREVPAEVVEDGQCDKYIYNDDLGPLGGRINYPYFKEDLFNRYIRTPRKAEYIRQFALSMRSAVETALDMNKINWYDEEQRDIAQRCFCYVGVDPSLGSKDPASFWLWGLASDKRKFWLDGVTKKMDPTKPEFWDTLFRLVMKWNSLSQGVVEIRIEDAGPSTWSSLAEAKLRERGCYVPVRQVKVAMAESAHRRNMSDRIFATGKANRIWSCWSPPLNHGEIWFPRPMSMGGRGIPVLDDEASHRDLVDYFLQVEYIPFPGGRHDDMLDAGSLLFSDKTNKEHPLQYGVDYDESDDGEGYAVAGSWMAP